MNNKEDFLSEILKRGSFFLLIKPGENIYSNTSIRNSFLEELESLVQLGLKNIEIGWSKNKNWLDFVSEIKIKYPRINLASASIVNKQSLEDSLKIGLNFSMMKFWDKDNSIDILKYKNIDFIATGGLSINDVKNYKSLGYKAIIIGDKGIKNKKFDPKIFEWLKNN